MKTHTIFILLIVFILLPLALRPFTADTSEPQEPKRQVTNSTTTGNGMDIVKSQESYKTENDQQASFLKELDSQIWWEWHWEKRHRHCMWAINWAAWVARVLLLAFASFKLTLGKVNDPLWLGIAIAVLALVNVAAPLLSVTFRFQQRQEVHDRNARAYSVIKVEYTSGQISLEEAVKRFTSIMEQPTEAVIRKTP
jgi:uncharacterized membrane protein